MASPGARSGNPMVDGFLDAQHALGGAAHAALQNAAAEAVRRMELGAAAGEHVAAQNKTGGAAIATFGDIMANPKRYLSDQALARADDLAARAGARSPAGATQKVVQDALNGLAQSPLGMATNFLMPVFAMGARMAARGIEASPIGLLGTAADVARAEAGFGPYARRAAVVPPPRPPFGSKLYPQWLANTGPWAPQPTVNRFERYGEAVTPLRDRLVNNLAGTALTGFLASKALDGTVTGEGPDDPAERANLEATGWRAHSVRVPGQGFVDYNRLPEQLKTPLVLAGAFGDAVRENPNDPGETAKSLGVHVAKALAKGLPGLQTLGDVGGILKGDPSSIGYLAGGGLSGYVPGSAVLSNLANAADPSMRQVDTKSGYQKAITDQFKSSMPFLREELPEATTMLGQPKPNPAAGIGQFLPARTPGEVPENTPGLASVRALNDIGVELPGIQKVAGLDPSPEEKARYEQARGAALDRLIPTATQDPDYQAADHKTQQALLRKAVTLADEETKAQFRSSFTHEDLRARIDKQFADATSKAKTEAQKTTAENEHDSAQASLAWSEVPHYYGVSPKGSPDEIARGNEQIRAAKAKLTAYTEGLIATGVDRTVAGQRAQAELRKDDPAAARLALQPNLEPEVMVRYRKMADAASGGALSRSKEKTAEYNVLVNPSSGLPLYPPAAA
jgi:hypothetical protein